MSPVIGFIAPFLARKGDGGDGRKHRGALALRRLRSKAPSMPTPEALMPALELRELESGSARAKGPGPKAGGRHFYGIWGSLRLGGDVVGGRR